tara:strand:+ start:36 stop:539 length:504 start_codon:yes stop_codon:yes gene_type:complete
MCGDTHIIRITNTSLASNLITNDNANASFTFELPAYLQKRKCKVSVIDSSICLRNASGVNRIVANDTHILVIRSNIQQFGWSTETNSNSNILGSAIIQTDTTNVVTLDAQESLTFICPELPPRIQIERMCYDPATPFKLIPANNYTANVVPLQITLSVEFFDEMDKK